MRRVAKKLNTDVKVHTIEHHRPWFTIINHCSSWFHHHPVYVGGYLDSFIAISNLFLNQSKLHWHESAVQWTVGLSNRIFSACHFHFATAPTSMTSFQQLQFWYILQPKLWRVILWNLSFHCAVSTTCGKPRRWWRVPGELGLVPGRLLGSCDQLRLFQSRIYVASFKANIIYGIASCYHVFILSLPSLSLVGFVFWLYHIHPTFVYDQIIFGDSFVIMLRIAINTVHQ